TSKRAYKLHRALDELPAKIEQLDYDIAALTAQTQAAGFFSQDRAITDKVLLQLQDKQTALERVYARWEELENT
ncbi:MAG TPA: ABC transporter ATP-binding protein, partial [Pseudomonadales bacterium]|nr:ABC transporter ATP-binding protein [Pseudomonadales bacterium]